MNERQERFGEFVVTRGDASEMLDPCKEALDQIASTVEMVIEFARSKAIGSGWNHRFGASRFDHGHEMVGVVAFVGYHSLARQILNQRRGTVDVGDLPGREDDAQRIAQRIDGDMQFGRQSAARAADILTACFFWAPAECWWARTIVESMNSCSMSASPPSTSATRSQTPLSRQRAKRMYVLCHLPNACGRSRHGLPVRRIQRTASTKSRLSFAVQPGSLALPGNRCSMRAHWSSRSIFRFILAPRKSQDMTTFGPL
jgi:hypothetical protein